MDWLFHTIWIKCLLSIRYTEFPYALGASTAISCSWACGDVGCIVQAVLLSPYQLVEQWDLTRDYKTAGSWISLGPACDEQKSAGAFGFQDAEHGRAGAADG